MGEIYLCIDMRLKRWVVIKLVRIASHLLVNNPDLRKALDKFEDEARILANLDHSHIVPLYSYGQERQGDDLLAYMVMPYYKDGSLETWWKEHRENKPSSVTEVARLLEQTGDAIQFAHAHGIIHRDIKLSNFLVRTHQGSPELPDLLLADFGIARLLQGTTTQFIRGTPLYMAPEQWIKHAEPATDQYALAVVAYYLLTRKYPFIGDIHQLMYRHTTVPPAPPSTCDCPHIPPAVDEVILRALAKRPEHRFPDVKAFTDAFSAASKPVPDPVGASSAIVPAPKPNGNINSPDDGIVKTKKEPFKKKWLRPIMALSLIVVLLGVPLLVWGPGVSRLSLNEFPMPASGGLPDGITLNPAGTVEFIELGGHAWQFSPDTEQFTPVTFSKDERARLFGAIISGANGTFWVTDYGQDQLFAFNTDGNELRSSLLPSRGGPLGMVQNHDGTLWVIEYQSNQLLHIGSDGKVLKSFPLPSGGTPAGIAQGPDGTLWVTDYQGNRIFHIALDGTTIAEFPLQPKSGPVQITVGSDDTVWFTEAAGNQIGRITPNGQLKEFPLSLPASSPAGITEGSDGNIWFTEAAGNRIGRITPDGQLTECELPGPDSRPNRITAGPENTLWFTEAAGRIGRVTLQEGLHLFGWLACF